MRPASSAAPIGLSARSLGPHQLCTDVCVSSHADCHWVVTFGFITGPLCLIQCNGLNLSPTLVAALELDP